MEIINATEIEIKVLKEMARLWMVENIEFIKTVQDYPAWLYQDKPIYHELMAGKDIYFIIQKLGKEKNDDGNRPAQS